MSLGRNTQTAKCDEESKMSIQSIIENELDLEEFIVDEEFSNFVMKKTEGESSKEDQNMDKSMKDILLSDEIDKPLEIGENDNQDDDLKLTWEDDLEEEDALLKEPVDSSTKSPQPSEPSSPFAPKLAHGLNKPDMMLEIPSQLLIEFSDEEEDLIKSLEMSSDGDLNDCVESKIINEEIMLRPVEDDCPLVDVTLAKIKSDINVSPQDISLTVENNIINTNKDSDPEMEVEIATKFLTQELNALDTETITYQEESILLQDDPITEVHTYKLFDDFVVKEDECLNNESKAQPENSIDFINLTNDEKDNSMVSLTLKSDVINQSTLIETKDKEKKELMEIVETELVGNKKKSITTLSNTQSNHKLLVSESNQNVEHADKALKIEKSHEKIDNVVSTQRKTEDTLDIPKDMQESTEVSMKVTNEIIKPLPCKDIEPQPSTSFSSIPGGIDTDDNKKLSKSTLEEKIRLPLINNENSLLNSITDTDANEMSDTLGLLAESSRVVVEEEEQDYEEYGEDDDFDHYEDENSLLTTAENSEDSNAHHSETDGKIEMRCKNNFEFTINNVTGGFSQTTDANNEVNINERTDDTKKTEDNDVNVLEDSRESHDSDGAVKDGEENKAESTSNTVLVRDENETNDKNECQELPSVNIETENNSSDFNIVDLGASSSDEDKQPAEESLSTVNIDIEMPEGNEVINNKDADQEDTQTSPKISQSQVEVFSLDSDEEEHSEQKLEAANEVSDEPQEYLQLTNASDVPKCISKSCPNTSYEFYIADLQSINYYNGDKKKRAFVCRMCYDEMEKRNQELVDGVKDFTCLLELSSKKRREELVEISDSESEEETERNDGDHQIIGKGGAKIIEERLADMINETWTKFKLDSRLQQSKDNLQSDIDKIKKESEELNDLLNECQAVTDKLRMDLYASFEQQIVELPALTVFDTPTCSYSCNSPGRRTDIRTYSKESNSKLKRSRSPPKETEAKRLASHLCGLGRLDDKTDQESNTNQPIIEKMDDDYQEVSVVKLSAEAAPAELPPPGDAATPALSPGLAVYAMRKPFCPWGKARLLEVLPKGGANTYTLCRVKYDNKCHKQPQKTVPARCLAYSEPPDARLAIGRRVVALFNDKAVSNSFYSGIIAEIPNPVNSYRYLVFFDDGYAQYAAHQHTRLVCETAVPVWEDVHPYSRDFVRRYLLAYPERPMVRLHAGQNLKTEWRGKWWSSRVLKVDASLVEVLFVDISRREWIYRGSTRLAPLYLEFKAAERHRPRAMPRTQPQTRTNMPYVEYTRSEEQTKTDESPPKLTPQMNEELKRQRAVAKKSTATSAPPPPQPASSNLDNVCSRVVYYTPKNAVKPLKMVQHVCSPKCKRKDVLALKDLRTYNPLAKPLLSGWERQIVRWKGSKEVMYKAPCGRRLRDMRELHRYLSSIESDMAVDLFDFCPTTHCLAEFVLNNCFVGKKDLSHGKENVPVPCVNYYDESLPEFCSYNTERTPTAGVPLNLDPAFLCGCDCLDDCQDKSKCACWKMTLEGAKTIGLDTNNVGYVYRRLPEPLPSGIYECNSRCKCKQTCLNRVAQHPLQLKLQVFKTANRGWGIRALNDIPKGAFLCVYAGNLLTDATANLDGLNEGDEYLAELDYIEVVEQMKEGYEDDIPANIKKLDKESSQPSEESEEEASSEAESNASKYEQEDDDFQPGNISNSVTEFNKRLRRRDSKKDKEDANQKEKEDEKKDKDSEKKEEKDDNNPDEECITISDDEEVREPSCFTAAAGMGANEFVSKYRSVRCLFGSDEACYIMDAKVQGNIGRYLNHSCCPNVFVQNVFVDTHDPRFPWVAFFALAYIKSGTELTWNYNYDVGSVPGKVLYCYCGAPNCRGRLL